jgi:putative ABC transport system permease protein
MLVRMRVLRTLAANPGFTIPAIGVLAVGIGVSAAMWSLVRAVVLHPVPWKDPECLAIVQELQRGQPQPIAASTANFLDWLEQNRAFEEMAATRFVYLNLADDRAEPDRVQALRVTARFLPMIGAPLALGRIFTADDEQPGADRIVLLANGFWRRRYGADPKVVGKAITVEGEPYRIAGVLGEFPMFQVLNRELEIYAPLTIRVASASREDHSINAYGRLRPGVSAVQAQSEMDRIARGIEGRSPQTNAGWGVKITPLNQAVQPRQRSQAEFLMASAVFVFLIACANIAGLMLAWSTGRRREVEIRAALGATRWRIVRQLLGDMLAISLAGGTLGALLADWTLAALDRSVSHSMLVRMTVLRVDGAVLAFTALISVAACVLAGFWPALRSSGCNLGVRNATERRGMGRWLIGAQAALATVLLIGSAMAARSTARLLNMDRGLDLGNVLTAQMWIPESRYASPASEHAFVERVLERVRAMKGVEAASVVSYPPLGLLGTVVPVEIEGRPAAERAQLPQTRFRVIDADFFRTMRLPVLAGRRFTEHDRSAVIVSETFAYRQFPGENALGKRIVPRFPGGDAFWYPASTGAPLEIIGVARDVNEEGIDVGPLPQIYLPQNQNPSRILHLLIRTQGDPLAWAAPLRAVMRGIDPLEPLFDIKPYRDIPRETFARQRAFGAMLGGAATLALLLAASGIYAQMTWTVSRRTREIGIRIAVGARPADVARFAVWDSLAPVICGVAIGIAGAFALHGTLAKLVTGLVAFDLPALSVGPAILLVAAIAAMIVPVRRALRVDPAESLRM